MDPWNEASNTSYNYPAHFLPSNIPGFMWTQIKPEIQKNQTFPLAIFQGAKHSNFAQQLNGKRKQSTESYK